MKKFMICLNLAGIALFASNMSAQPLQRKQITLPLPREQVQSKPMIEEQINYAVEQVTSTKNQTELMLNKHQQFLNKLGMKLNELAVARGAGQDQTLLYICESEVAVSEGAKKGEFIAEYHNAKTIGKPNGTKCFVYFNGDENQKKNILDALHIFAQDNAGAFNLMCSDEFERRSVSAIPAQNILFKYKNLKSGFGAGKFCYVYSQMPLNQQTKFVNMKPAALPELETQKAYEVETMTNE